MARSTVSRKGAAQSVSIPLELAFPDTVQEVEVIRSGDVITIVPTYSSWKEWAENGPRVSDDFMTERDQGQADGRELV